MIPHLLMVRLLDQFLGVIQFSDQGILKRGREKVKRWQINSD